MTYTSGLEQLRLLEGTQLFELNSDKHRVWVSVIVSPFSVEDKAYLRSDTQCVPCNDAPKEGLEQMIDDLHINAFGAGQWLYVRYALHNSSQVRYVGRKTGTS
jgi:hypothetical protein